MQYQSEILRFKEGARKRHPSPEATIAAAQPGSLTGAGSQIAVLVDLAPELPYRSREIRTLAVKTYWASSGSIVARLRRALVAANRHLVHFNKEATAGNKCSGNITCAVFADDELFVGQVGAAYTFVFHTDQEPAFELFPKRDRVLMPLGATAPPVIHVSYTKMSPGSLACLVTTPIAEAQAREVWQQTLSLPKLSTITHQISRDIGNTGVSGSVILVRPHVLPIPKRRKGGSGFLRKHREEIAKVDQVADVEQVAKATQTTQDRPPSHVSVPAEAPRPPSLSNATTTAEQPVGHHTAEKPRMKSQRQGAVPDGEGQSAQAPDMISTATSRSEPARTSAEAKVNASQASGPSTVPEEKKPRISLPNIALPSVQISLEPLRNWFLTKVEERKQLRDMRKGRTVERQTTAERARLRKSLRTLLPGKIERKDTPVRRTPPEEHPSVMAGVVLGVLLITLFITISTYMQLGGPHRADELLIEARELLTQAYTTQEPEEWYRLLDLSSKIVRLNPESVEAQEIQEEAREAIDVLENAAVLNITPLLDLGTAPTPRRVIAAGNWLYILNTATDAVIAYPLNEDLVTSSAEGPTTILRRGQTYNGEEVPHIIDLAWIAPGGTYQDGAVFIYSEGGTVYIYEPALGPGSITFQRMQGAGETGRITAMETFGEKFYLIDRQQNQILMYEPVNGIYESPRSYFGDETAPILHNAVDVAIDGRVYLLMGDGEIQAYFSGSYDHSFDIAGLPDTDFAPRVMTIEADLDDGLVYLGDTRDARILVLDKRGNFIRQFRLPQGEIEQIEALTIREDAKILYLIGANKLYAAPVPSTTAE